MANLLLFEDDLMQREPTSAPTGTAKTGLCAQVTFGALQEGARELDGAAGRRSEEAVSAAAGIHLLLRELGRAPPPGVRAWEGLQGWLNAGH